jgi:hypothetical protein
MLVSTGTWSTGKWFWKVPSHRTWIFIHNLVIVKLQGKLNQFNIKIVYSLTAIEGPFARDFFRAIFGPHVWICLCLRTWAVMQFQGLLCFYIVVKIFRAANAESENIDNVRRWTFLITRKYKGSIWCNAGFLPGSKWRAHSIFTNLIRDSGTKSP